MRPTIWPLLVGLCLSCAPGASAPPRDEPGGVSRDASLSTSYLRDRAGELGAPRVVIGRYDVSRGLLAAFQSTTGKRLLFRARFRPGGGVVAQILHLDPQTGELAHLIGRSKRLDDLGQPVRDVEIAGVDIRALMSRDVASSARRADGEAQLARFVAGETGRALLDGVPALYAALDGLDQEAGAARLLEPLGAVTMALQLATRQFSGFQSADALLRPAQARSLRDACGGEADCLVRGRHFMVHRSSGLFDALGDRPGAARGGTSAITRSSGTSSAGGDGICGDMSSSCFGLCGPECITPGDIAAPQCFGHDYCVCAYSHGDCLTSVPDGCGEAQGVTCYSLWEAVGGWLGGLWDAFWDWVDEWFEGVDDESSEP